MKTWIFKGNYVPRHFSANILIPDIICLLEALSKSHKKKHKLFVASHKAKNIKLPKVTQHVKVLLCTQNEPFSSDML